MSRPVAQPSSVKPFNRRLLAQGRALPPTGQMRAERRGHLRRQDLLGYAIAALALYGVIYGVRLVLANGPEGAARGDFSTPLYGVVGVAAVAAVACRVANLRTASAERHARDRARG